MDDLASEKDATANDMAPLQPLDVKPGECRLEFVREKTPRRAMGHRVRDVGRI